MHDTKKLSRKFTLMFIAYFTAQIVFFGFWPSILRDFGYSDTFIGICSSISTFCGMALRLLISYYFDRKGHARALVIGCISFYCVMQSLVFFFSGAKWIVLLFSASAMSTVGLVYSISEAWLLKLSAAGNEKLDYGKLRSAGSMAYAVSGLFAGSILAAFGNVASCGIVWAAWLVLVPLTLSVPEAPRTLQTAQTAPQSDMNFLQRLQKLVKNKAFLLFMLCGALDTVCEMTVTGNFSIIVQELGGTQAQSGVGFFVMAFSEFWVVYFFSRLARRFTVHWLYAAGIFGTLLRAVAMSMAKTPWQAVALIALNAVSFGLTAPGKVLLINDLVDYEFKAAAMQIYNIGTSVVRMLILPLQGMVSDRYGILSMIRIFSVFSLLSFIIITAYFVRRQRKEAAAA
ncbi:MAG: MFS transporter [Oscillospiraceae bacterium]|nr:MFS transporter [Oscillospiraceae bacterium]